MSVSTKESFRDNAKVIRKFMKEKYNIDVPHGHCMELISQISGYRDWNTASADLKKRATKSAFPIDIKTVGDLKKALELFEDTDTIDADYKFNIRDFLNDLEPDEEEQPTATRHQEFSLSLNGHNDDIVTFKLKLENESMGW